MSPPQESAVHLLLSHWKNSYNAAHKAVSEITLRLEPDNPDTEKFLSGTSEKDEAGFPPSAFTFAPSAESGISSGLGKGTVIPADEPEILAPLADSIQDWNHCT